MSLYPTRVRRFEKLFWLLKVNVVLLLIFYGLRVFSGSSFDFFSNSVYPLLNGIYGFSSALAGLVHLALFDVLLASALVLIFILFCQSAKNQRRLRSFLLLPLKILTVILFLACWFQLSWGFYYQQKLFLPEKQLAQEVEIKEEKKHHRLYAQTLKELHRLEKQLEFSSATENLYKTMLPQIIAALNDLPVAPFHLARAHQPFRSGSLSYLLSWVGAAGMYSPFSHELFIARSVPPLERIFVATHELAHLMGFAREDDAELAAFLALRKSKEPWLRFTALSYIVLRVPLHLEKQRSISALPISLQYDRAWAALLREQYPAYVSELAWAVYNVFLKSQGVKEGVASYGIVGRLIHANPDLVTPLLQP